MNQLHTFENSLFPPIKRWQYALRNVASDFSLAGKIFEEKLHSSADRLYTGFQEFRPASQMGVMNLLLPVGCNATCPKICYTNAAQWKRNKKHLNFYQIKDLLDRFGCNMEGKLIRIVGDGEPTLYKQLPDILSECALKFIIFSNGITLSLAVMDEYAANENVYFYIKLWSENRDVQNYLVAPKCGEYKYVNGRLGPAPKVFYDLYDIDPSRVGFQVMVSVLNLKDTQRIIKGPKSQVPLFVEPFIPEGSGKGNEKLIVRNFTFNKECENPPRASYLGVVNSKGELQAGTFVTDGAIPVKDSFEEAWKYAFGKNTIFAQARYNSGCFCETMRNCKRK